MNRSSIKVPRRLLRASLRSFEQPTFLFGQSYISFINNNIAARRLDCKIHIQCKTTKYSQM